MPVSASGLSDPLKSDDPKQIADALKKGADPGKVDFMGMTPLHYQAAMGSLPAVKALLKAGAAVDARVSAKQPAQLMTPPDSCGPDKGYQGNVFPGATPLMLAAQFSGCRPKEYLDVVKLLLKKGAAVDGAEQGGPTPLMAAAELGTDEVVKALLAGKARVDAETESGDTALTVAVFKKREWLVRELLKRGAKADAGAMVTAAAAGNLETVRLLADRGADLEAQNWQKATPLIAASFGGHTPVVRYLLERKADPNRQGGDGFTPLHYAATRGNLESVSLLLKAGADRKIPNKAGKTALELANDKGHKGVAELLSKP